MTYKEVEAGELVIEYGTFGDEFYVILEGECEVMVPDKRLEEVKNLAIESSVFEERLKDARNDIESLESYLQELKQTELVRQASMKKKENLAFMANRK